MQTQTETTQKYVVRFTDGSGYAVFDLGPDDIISPSFPTEKEAEDWLDNFVNKQAA